MSRRRLINSVALISCCALVLVMNATAARGEAPAPKVKKDNRECASSFKSGTEREKAGHLVEATKLYLKCSSVSCGGTMSQECAARNIKLFSQLPTVVVLASDGVGEPLVDVEVKMDGELLTSHLDGLALPVDPGTHEFTFSAAGSVFSPQKVTVVSGERNRPVSASAEGGQQRPQTGPVSSSETHH